MVYMDLQGLLRREQGVDFAVHLGGILMFCVSLMEEAESHHCCKHLVTHHEVFR